MGVGVKLIFADTLSAVIRSQSAEISYEER